MSTDHPSGQRRTWRTAAGPRATDTGPRPDWHQAEAAAAVRPGRGRRLLVGAAAASTVAVAAGFVSVLLWPRPPHPVRFVLVAAGYETNLAVPHNVAGRRGLDDLRRWADEHNARFARGGRALVDVKVGELARAGDALARGLGGASPVVVFLAAHGGADADGPYFLAHDADLRDDRSLYRLDRALDHLRALPQETKKLLLIDATQVAAHWPSGQLSNDFARALARRESLVRDVPNLVVVSSSAPDQRSWVAAEWGRTAFAHYVLEGLRGGADRAEAGNGDGRVDALELFGYVRRKVERWARHNRAALQTPVLVGDEAVARSIELVSAGEFSEEAVPAAGPSEGDLAAVREVWSRCEQLRRGAPHPAAYTPLSWRTFLDAALRHEELVRAGDSESAARLRTALQGLGEQIVRGRSAGVGASGRLTLAMPEAVGGGLSADEARLVRRFEAEWEWDSVPVDKLAAVAKDLKVPAPRPGSLARLAAQDVLLRKLEQEPQRLASAAAALARLGDDPLAPRPAESHLALMLHGGTERDGPSRVARLLAAGRADLVAQALRTRRLAEQAALGVGGEGADPATLPAYSEQVLAAVREQVEKADRERRLGEDLLFTTDGQRWDEARGRLAAAERLYGEARGTAVALRRGLHARNVALAELPYFAHCPQADEGRLVVAWGRAHELADRLAGRPSTADPAGAAARLEEDLRSLGRLARAPREEFQSLQGTWHEIEGLLQLPFIPTGERIDLVKESQRISHSLNEETARATDAGGPSAEANEREARAAARRQGVLALATLGPAWRNELLRLREGNGRRDDLRGLGGDVGRALRALPALAREQTARAAGESAEKAVPLLNEAAEAARRLDGAAFGDGPGAPDPVGEQRRLLLYELLRWQAERTARDFWASESPAAGRAYYEEAADLFLRDALGLVRPAAGASARAARERLRERPHRRLAFRWRPGRGGAWAPFPGAGLRLDLSDEKQVDRAYQLDPPAGADGEPVVWVEAAAGLRFQAPETQRRAFAAFEKPLPVSFVPALPDNGNGAFRSRYDVIGLFRGHEARATTDVRFYRRADFVFLQPLPPPEGRVAMQTALLDAAGNSAVAVVLDCSGSMTYKVKGGGTRFEQLAKALLAVMDRLPPGVPVSLRVFGGLGGTGAETARLWGARPWKARRPGRVDGPAPATPAELARALDGLAARLGGGTPLVRAVWEARDDFPEDFDGFKTVVVLTDGVDSTFATNGSGLPRKADDTAASFLAREFERSGVVVNAIGFEVGELGEEEKKIQKDFEEGITALKGEYRDVAAGEDLAAPIERAVRRLRFEVGADRGTPAPGPLPLEPIDITRTDEPAAASRRWGPLLAAGPYQVRVQASRPLRQSVEVGPGDRLLLELVRDDASRLALRRALYAESPPVRRARHVAGRWRVASRDGRDWLLAVLQNEPLGGGLQLMATLEKDEGLAGPGQPVQQVRPRLAWLEVAPAGAAGSRPPLRVAELSGYPAPAWGLTLREWPGQGVPPVLDAWWTETDLPPARALRREIDFKGIGDLDYVTLGDVVRAEGERPVSVVVDGARQERRRVEVEPGTYHEDVPCLVVRLRYDPDLGPFFVRLPGRDVGQEHRFYFEAGMYVGVFWSRGMAEAPDPRTLHLVSVAALKERALNAPRLRLDPPDAAWRRPAPE